MVSYMPLQIGRRSRRSSARIAEAIIVILQHAKQVNGRTQQSMADVDRWIFMLSHDYMQG
jgi:hypothetical protein